MIAVIDYDAGNIRSVEKALVYLGFEAVVTRKESEILKADGVILPGVGAFGDAMERLKNYGLVSVLRKAALEEKKPLLGICLGLQLFFEGSEESEGIEGLSLMKGRILRIPEEAGLPVPHIGWNSLTFPKESRLFYGIPKDPYVYFVHSYYLKAAEEAVVAARTEYGVQIDAAVESGHLFACQFHPEKSSTVGLSILRNFCETCASNNN